jgi:hypothetical protein
MKYWLLIAAGMIVAAGALSTAFLLRANDPSRGVFVLGDKHIQIAQNEDGSVQWDGRPMTCDEIVVVLREAEKNCGKMPVPFNKIHFGPFECLSVPTPEELARRPGSSTPNCPPYPSKSFFSGSLDDLAKIRDFGGKEGFTLEISTSPDGGQRILLTPDLLSNTAFRKTFDEAMSGRLGTIGFGIESGPLGQTQ